MKCDDCGKFATIVGGASTAAMYDMVGMQLDHEHFRCASCTRELGPVQSNARPSDGDMTPYQSVHR